MTFSVKAPILGFEHIKNLELEKIDDFFFKLKSCEDGTVFMLINPFMIRDYDFIVPEFYKNLLELNENSKPLVYNIMIISTPIEISVINFIAPLVFNVEKSYVAQIILDSSKYKEYGIAEKISDYMEKEERSLNQT
ncbi:MAG: flagellar assembly protein FliW [Sulfurospirillum sp.]